MLRVKKIPGEATRYWVEGASLNCIRCGNIYKRKPAGYEELPWVVAMVLHMLHGWLPGSRCLTGLHCELERLFVRVREKSPLREGDLCTKPGCGGRLEVRYHVVDIAANGLNGRCSCEYFSMSLEPKVRDLPLAQQGEGRYRCSHIPAARDFALDVSIQAHEKVRYANAHGQQEEAQP